MHLFIVFFLLCFFAPFAHAESLLTTKQKPVTTEELATLLSGNSISGEIEGFAFKQYFSPSGTTVVKRENSEPEVGRWRVGHDNKLCTLWDNVIQSCYFAFQESSNSVRWMGPINGSISDERISSITILYRGNITGVPTNDPAKATDQSFERGIGKGIRNFFLY